jgi:hypothetical protein
LPKAQLVHVDERHGLDERRCIRRIAGAAAPADGEADLEADANLAPVRAATEGAPVLAARMPAARARW